MSATQTLPILTWVEATAGNPRHQRLWDYLRREVEALAAGRAEIDFVHLPTVTGGIRTPANRLMNDTAVLAAALDRAYPDRAFPDRAYSADDGRLSDATVIGCWGAPTEVVRAALNGPDRRIPVTSLPDAAARLMGSLARKAVVVTVSPALVPIFEDDLRRLQAAGFHEATPVRAYDPESTHDDLVDALDDPSAMIARFDAVARRAVEEDGADAIVVGCGYLAPIFTGAGYTHVGDHPDVPVIDCSRLAMEHALLLLELEGRGIGATSGAFPPPRGPQFDALRAAAARLGGGELLSGRSAGAD
ncbi:aspartate/glutamate racemase family protein [Leucobacter sp. GX24907]